ncbi:Tat-linked quality control protein TatD [Planctomycetes bacterium Poly30]|uniref:Tat-linked quality control protein TatD n=1 Tax=Saltatorellus ferox TaxID=2528018 RepID=A0A518ELR4_9BACT|nr:Tat-linked quality control protein TatD [Planctomycetes bacterium Poly30]
MELIDIGVNLGSQQFKKDLDDVMARARAADVAGMVITGTSLAGSLRALEIARGADDLWCTAGVHPHDAKTWSDSSAITIRKLCADSKVVAVGECGLDFNRNFSEPEAQRAAYSAQLGIAAETSLPVFLHQRDAHDEFFSTLKDAWPDLGGGAVVHCFTDGPAEAEAYLELGCYLGITGWVTDARRGDALRRAVPLIPDERLLLETDAPYLMPQSIRPRPKSRRNEPMHMIEVARAVAELRGQAIEEVAALSTANARHFFALTAGGR